SSIASRSRDAGAFRVPRVITRKPEVDLSGWPRRGRSVRVPAEAGLIRNLGFFSQLGEERVERDEAQIGLLAGAVLAHRDALGLDLFIPDHERVRHLRELRLPDHPADAALRAIDLDSQTRPGHS